MLALDRRGETPLHQQLYTQLKEQITDGTLPKGERLPPTRELAAEYHLSRNTVVQAYQQLEVEGYVRSVVGSGYYVEDLGFLRGPWQEGPPALSPAPEEKTEEPLFDFYYGDLDYNCYRSRAWRDCLLEACDRLAGGEVIAYGAAEGMWELRSALARQLRLSRGVRCSPEQVILTGGHQRSLAVVARMFGGGEWSFAMEDPGYDGTRAVMGQNGFSPIPVPLEEDGVSVAAAEKLRRTLLYITPSHQLPMGSVLPIAKRLALLQWAAESDSYILEDDYDSELRYHSLPIPSLQSIDSGDRTIYLGTFSKSLSPDLRVAYMVLPRGLMERYHRVFSYEYCDVSTLLQLALERSISGGEYQRHINAMRTHYRKKHDLIQTYVKERLSDRARLIGADSGLHFVLEVDSPLSQGEMVERLAEEKLRLYETAPFWHHPARAPHNQLLLGFGSIPLARLPEAMERLERGLRKL